MHNNITELTQRLLRALDSNYNVIDMVTVLEVITVLEKVSITMELLETTRLGKHINDLRRNTTNESLAKRAKELLKSWRSKVLPIAPDTNGQIRTAAEKRPIKDRPSEPNSKRSRINGASEYEFSDNSNSSFKEGVMAPKSGVILINSDSNSSIPDVKNEPVLEEPQPKKRGRKKGSKNHRNLLDEAETSFTNKMAVSRGNAKVKTTQELIAGLQNKNNTAVGNVVSPTKNIEDWNERAAKLTERVSLIDQKLNASANRPKKKKGLPEVKVPPCIIESGSVSNELLRSESPDDEIVIVDDDDPSMETAIRETTPPPPPVEDSLFVPSLSVEEAFARLPPIDLSCLNESSEDLCICPLKDNQEDEEDRFNFVEIPECPALAHFEQRHRLKEITRDRIDELHTRCLDSVNGNFGLDLDPQESSLSDEIKIVPNFYELSPKDVDRDNVCENYKKYSISEECGGPAVDNLKFREFHQVLDRPSYNGDVLRILPYVVID